MRTLLLADDSITVQRVIALTFAEEAIRVVTVADGQQAMEKMAAQRPDIVLAGTTLPQISGYDLARFMRSKPDLQQVPVLLLSGAFESVDAARLKASGANGVLEKPVEPTIVIGRVKELLGMKGDVKPAAPTRSVTPAEVPPERKMPVATPPRAVTSTRGTPSRWDQLRNQTGLEPDTRSVEDSSTRSDDYLDTLDAAFDTLDQQLSGRAPSAKQQRNPAGPIGQAAGAADPRSPGRRPPANGAPKSDQVFEVDDEWFGGTESPAQAGRREFDEDLNHPELRAQTEAPASPIYEIDDEWFAEDDKARAQKAAERDQLAAEMGLHDVDLPEVAAQPAGVPNLAPHDLDFGIEDIRQIQAQPAPAPVAKPVPPPAPVAVRPPAPPVVAAPAPVVPPPPVAARVAAPEPVAPIQPMAPIAPVEHIAPVVSPQAPPSSLIADDFAALLAFEQGEQPHPQHAQAAAPKVAAAPEITQEMLDQIAARVTERLSASAFGDQLRDTIRRVVSETSERLVRDEIERIRSKRRG